MVMYLRDTSQKCDIMIVLEKPGKSKTSKTEKREVPVMNGEEVYGNNWGKGDYNENN